MDPIEQMLGIVLDDDRELAYPYSSAYALTHAYAATMHKIQGSKFTAVIIVLLTSHAAMLGRTLVYTALTRAPRLAVFVGQRRALALAVCDWRLGTRRTAPAELLVHRLRFCWPELPKGPTSANDEVELWEEFGGGVADPLA